MKILWFRTNVKYYIFTVIIQRSFTLFTVLNFCWQAQIYEEEKDFIRKEINKQTDLSEKDVRRFSQTIICLTLFFFPLLSYSENENADVHNCKTFHNNTNTRNQFYIKSIRLPVAFSCFILCVWYLTFCYNSDWCPNGEVDVGIIRGWQEAGTTVVTATAGKQSALMYWHGCF